MGGRRLKKCLRSGAALGIAVFLGLPSEGAAQTAPRGSASSATPPTWESVRATVQEARRIVAPLGVEETKQVEIGGLQQWISVRGRDRRNPILLYIHGGPGVAETPLSWYYQTPWEEFFTVVQWDQRGAGKTAATSDPTVVNPTISIARLSEDGEEMVAYLRKAYGKKKIFVLGHSWGSVIGMNLAQKRPEWLHAYIGMGQIINMPESEKVSYEFTLEQARLRGDPEAEKALQALAPYVAADGQLSPDKMSAQRKVLRRYGGMTWGRSDLSYEQAIKRFSPDYVTPSAATNNAATRDSIIPGLSHVDFRPVKRLNCPVFIFAGRHDYAVPSAVTAAWFDKLHAPKKELFWFEQSAHMMEIEQPGALLLHLVNDIRPLAVKAGDAPPTGSSTSIR